jgi:3',5'-cyclic AMP phosphodiesterase CpdA
MHKYLLTILIIVLTLFMPVKAQEADDTVVKFVQISDPQVMQTNLDNSRRLFKDSFILLKDAIDQLNELEDIEFVIFTGDMIDSAQKSDMMRFISYADKLKYPWYPVLGNHDVSYGGYMVKKNLIPLMKAHTRGMQNDKGYYTFYPSTQTAIIVLDGTMDFKHTVHGYLDPEQLKWFQTQLEHNKDRVVIVALHYPIIPPFSGSNHTIYEPGRTEALNMIRKYPNVALVISGHYHTTSIKKDGKQVHACAPALVEYPNAFRIINIKENGDIVFEWKETRLKDLQQKSKNRSKWAATSYGKQQDREATINYKQ